MMFFSKSRKEQAKDLSQREKLAQSHQFLIEAAVATADAAMAISTQLKKKLDDEILKFEATSRVLNDALIICDINGTIQHANEAAAKTFGGNLVNLPILKLFHGGEIPSPMALFDRMHDEINCLQTAESPLKGVHLQTGETFYIEPKLERLDWHDKTSSMLILVRDSDESKRLRAEASDLQEYYNVFSANCDGIVLVQGEMIVAANASIQRLFGYNTEELLDHSLSTLFPLEEHEKIGTQGDPHQMFVTGLHENGSSLNLIYSSTTVHLSNRDVRIVTIREIADQKRLEELANFKRDNGIDMVVCFDPSYRVTFVNGSFAKFYNMKRSDIMNCHIRDIIGEDEFTALQINQNNLTPTNTTARCQIQTSLQQSQTLDWISHVIFDSDGNPTEYQCTGRDISEILMPLTSYL